MEGRKVLGIAALIGPVLMLVRALSKHSAAEAEYQKSSEKFSEHVRELNTAESEAKKVGATMDEEGCVRETKERTRKDATFAGTSMGASFLRGCLEASRPSPGYCDSVPPYRATMPPEDEKKGDAWRKAQCADIPGSNWSCAAQFKFVQLHCHPLK